MKGNVFSEGFRASASVTLLLVVAALPAPLVAQYPDQAPPSAEQASAGQTCATPPIAAAVCGVFGTPRHQPGRAGLSPRPAFPERSTEPAIHAASAQTHLQAGPAYYLLPAPGDRRAPYIAETAASLDLAIARALRATDLQESGTARAVAGVFRLASLPGTLLLAGTLYGIGEMGDRDDLSDLGVHTGQAILGAGAVTLAGKLAAGRARPRISPENASDFALGRGFRGNDYQAFPSAHTASAFAAGTVLALDIAERHPGSAAWVYPSVYAAATMAGLSRLFEEEHWATDIVGGALIGIVGGIVVNGLHGESTSP